MHLLLRTAAALLTALSTSTAWSAPDTIHVDAQGAIHTAAGERLVMRGLNEMFVWSNDPLGKTLIPQIDQTGSNALRLVWDHKVGTKADLLKLIDATIARKMVAIPECHNATGKWGEALQGCINFWNDPALIKGIEAQRRWTILNIANEAGDGKITDEDFLATYGAAVESLRRWGYTVPLMIDAAGWGQNIEQLLRVAPALLKRDPLRNLIFSAHSYWPADKALDHYRAAAGAAKALGVAVVVGEGPSVTRVGQCDDPKPLPYLEGMQILHEAGVGWLNWSWGGWPNGDCNNFKYFDIAEGGVFGKWPHEPGAQIVALSPFGLMQSSARPASFYADGIVRPSGVYVHVAKPALNVGETTAVTTLVAPANARNKAYSLKLSDEGIARFDLDGRRLTALKPGKARLTATTHDGALSFSAEVEVK
jgi:mannan endo-1,4-beta-mannosidase